jgi:HEPN domain-containing protein
MKKSKQYLADCKDFLNLARLQLEYVGWDIKGGYHDPACFWSHQVGEKALKAYLFYNGIGLIKKHYLETELLPRVLEFDRKAVILKSACEYLDQFYIPARYGGAERPFGGYTEETADTAYKHARKILSYVESKIKLR